MVGTVTESWQVDIERAGAMDWMFVAPPHPPPPPPFIYWSPNLKCDGIWRWGLWEVIRFRWGHESGIFMMGLVSLQEEEERPEVPLSIHKHWGKAMWRQREGSCLQVGSRALSRTESISTLVLDFSGSRIVRNKCLSFKAPVYGILL